MHAHCLWREHSSGVPSNSCFKQGHHKVSSLASPALLLLCPGARHLPQSFLSPHAAPLCACTAHISHGQLLEEEVARLFKRGLGHVDKFSARQHCQYSLCLAQAHQSKAGASRRGTRSELQSFHNHLSRAQAFNEVHIEAGQP